MKKVSQLYVAFHLILYICNTGIISHKVENPSRNNFRTLCVREVHRVPTYPFLSHLIVFPQNGDTPTLPTFSHALFIKLLNNDMNFAFTEEGPHTHLEFTIFTRVDQWVDTDIGSRHENRNNINYIG